MSAGPDQLVLDLPHRAALGVHDFLISPSNRAAADTIDLWPNWPQASVAVVAPAHAGKTHLGNVWRLKSGAARLEAPALSEADVPAAAAHGAVLVEDLHAGIADERALFHLLNLVREHKLSVLLTSRTPPGEIEASLPDLRSRLRALPLVTIEPPDETLLKAVLVKHFTDRQLIVEPGVIAYIALRMERSMEAAAAIVAAIDRTAMAGHRKVTRVLAAEVLAQAARVAGGRD
ncbi:MAG TPA: DnaA/Hda family protein [Hyphomicrobiaceae bacterium]|nr:DnaA/Hda family protein [Hyphomicrobiaceae bacterium]